ncbi:unnamed protein product [uncultured bacterium]|nr:unnamed protein product [uncultured bacterium]
MTTELPAIDPNITMAGLLERYPGAQRALFRKYHIGGCSSCGFRPDETLAGVCARNENLPIEEVTAWIQKSHEEDLAMQISPFELKSALDSEPAAVKLLDIRTREEFDAAQISGSALFTQELMNTILMDWPRETGVFAIIDHQGTRSMDASAYFQGHGFQNVKALRGGIDAWSVEVDPSVPRYQIE